MSSDVVNQHEPNNFPHWLATELYKCNIAALPGLTPCSTGCLIGTDHMSSFLDQTKQKITCYKLQNKIFIYVILDSYDLLSFFKLWIDFHTDMFLYKSNHVASWRRSELSSRQKVDLLKTSKGKSSQQLAEFYNDSEGKLVQHSADTVQWVFYQKYLAIH